LPYVLDSDMNGQVVFTPGISIGINPEEHQMPISLLKHGDILIWAHDPTQQVQDTTHSIIRDASGGAYSHVGLYVGKRNGSPCTIDAGPNGVRVNALADLLKEFSIARVFRSELSQEKLSLVVQTAFGFCGKRTYAMGDVKLLPFRRRVVRTRGYVFPRLVLLRLSPIYWFGKIALLYRRHFPPEGSTYCSQMVIEAYAAAGFFNPDHLEEAAISPNDLAIGNFFRCIGFLTRRTFDGTPPPSYPMDLFAPSAGLREKWDSLIYRILWRL
jgi:hypothetical protein